MCRDKGNSSLQMRWLGKCSYEAVDREEGHYRLDCSDKGRRVKDKIRDRLGGWIIEGLSSHVKNVELCSE